MNQNLTQAAQQGDINALYVAISSDPFILDKIDRTPFIDTPLHVAASAGKTHFALEIMMLKPSLARKLNQNGYSAMHLASMNGDELLVKVLLSKDKDLVRVNGREGKTPIHCMAATGVNPSLLEEMLNACPDSVKELTVKGETALHVAVKNNQYEAFKVLVKCIKAFQKEKIYYWKDEEGYTVLHHATMRSQIQTIKLLFQTNIFKEWRLGVDILDGSGRTALDIIKQLPEQLEHRDSIKNILIPGRLSICERLEIAFQRTNLESIWKNIFRRKPWSGNWNYMVHKLSLIQELSTDSRNTYLVVLALVITTLFQVGVNPPGGFWQADGSSNGKKYSAGTPILATTSPGLYQIISVFTMAGFTTSVYLTILLTIGMPLKYLLLAALGLLSLSYLVAYIAITHTLGLQFLFTTYFFVLLCVFIGMFYSYVYLRHKIKAGTMASL